MSEALAEPVVQAGVEQVLPAVTVGAIQHLDDPHPLVPVFVFGAVALTGAIAVVGIILALLALRPMGICAPF